MGEKRYANFRVLKEDLEQLKIVAALSRESMLQTFTRLVRQENERMLREGGKRYAAVQKDQA
jgi:L-lactate utilization protein LutB